MRDSDFYRYSPVTQLESFGICALTIDEAAEFVAKILCLEDCLDKKVPDEADQYTLDNPILPDLLKEEIEDYEKAILAGVEKGTLKTIHVSRDIHDQIDTDDTFIDVEVLQQWFSERDVEIAGNIYADYMEDRMKVLNAAVDAIGLAEYRVKHNIREEFDSSQSEKVFLLEKQVQDLEEQLVAIKQNDTPKTELKTRERDTLLKLVIGMAVEQYGYNPSSGRNDATANIQNDLALCGLSMHVDTILAKLREASDLLPPQDVI